MRRVAVLACLLAAAGPAPEPPPAPPQAMAPQACPAMAPYLDLAYCDAWEHRRKANEAAIQALRVLMGESPLTDSIAKLFDYGACPRMSGAAR